MAPPRPTSGPMIETHDLRRTFKSRKSTVEAVRGVDLSVGAGEIFGFLGPNGAGKTTTLRMLATLLTPTGGRGDGRRRRPAPRAAAGPRADRLRPAGRLDRPGRDRPRRARHPGPAVRHDKADAERRAAEVLAALDLEAAADRHDRAPTRAACAAGSTSGSASSTGPRSCSSTSRRPGSTRRPAPACGTRSAACASAGTTVFLTTHYLEEADALADRLAIIDHGRIVAEGTADELKRQVAGDVVTLGVNGATERVLETVRAAAVRARGHRRGRRRPALRRPRRDRRPAAPPRPRRRRPGGAVDRPRTGPASTTSSSARPAARCARRRHDRRAVAIADHRPPRKETPHAAPSATPGSSSTARSSLTLRQPVLDRLRDDASRSSTSSSSGRCSRAPSAGRRRRQRVQLVRARAADPDRALRDRVRRLRPHRRAALRRHRADARHADEPGRDAPRPVAARRRRS